MAETIGEKNKGSTDMKKSTFLPDWEEIYFFVELNEKSFSLEWHMLLISVFYIKTRQVKTLLYSHTRKSCFERPQQRTSLI